MPGDHETFGRCGFAMYLPDGGAGPPPPPLAGDTMADKPYYPAGRAISRVQIELLATKVSSLNGCAY